MVDDARMPTQNRIAVAGISGYTGLRLLPLLDDDARLLMRPSTARKDPWRTDPRTISVDLLDVPALEHALRGCDTIVCLVGTTRAQFRPAKDGEPEVSYETVDIGIPRALALAGKRAGCKRFVLLSSYGTDSPGAYPAAKRAAEAAVKEAGLATVILRPSFIVGPGRAAPKALDVVWAPVRLFARGVADDMRSFDVEELARVIDVVARSSEWDGQVLSGRQLHAILEK
jgi:nucleoside-diphosphate-sugar epimerase